MKCPRCQHANPPRANFCAECGGPLSIRCRVCQSEVPGSAKFCGECGQELEIAVASATVRFGSAESYTPRHLAERILSSRAMIEGERKQVTVLFADLKGSMELLADRDPEDARRVLDAVLELMLEAVHHYEGTVNQVMGDGIMALFGAPLAHEDHAVRACYAGLRMQESVGRTATEMERALGVRLQIRVGINSGEVVVRSIARDLHMDYAAVGRTTHLAARMEQIAQPGSILVSPETWRLAEGYVTGRALGPTAIKGLSEALVVYEVTGRGLAETRLQAAAAHGFTPFVGRAFEQARLRRQLDAAARARGNLVALVGEPGVGKSRLVFEFVRGAETSGWLELNASAVSYGKATPYLPVLGLLRRYFQIEARDSLDSVMGKIAATLAARHPALGPAPFLALFDAPVVDPAWTALDPPQRRERTLEAVRRLILEESLVQPVLLVVEDLQWIDSETQAILDRLVEDLSTAKILMIVDYRPEYRHGWAGRDYYSEIQIDPLPPETADEMLRGMLGSDPDLEDLTQVLIDRTEGNALFLEESVRSLVETRALVGERGQYRLATAPDTIEIPATVQAILAARIDRLDSEDKRLLQSAAVVGKDVPVPLLEVVANGNGHSVRRGLARLQAADFLYETGFLPELAYTFKHALTHDVAYAGVLHQRRRELHGRVMEAIEGLYPDRGAEHVEQLARHALGAEAWERAIGYLRRAGAKAVARSASRQAVAYFERALAALKHLPETPAVLSETIDVSFELRHALLPLGDLEQIRECLERAGGIAQTLGDERRQGWVSGYMTHYFLTKSDLLRAVESGQRSLEIAARHSDLPLEVEMNLRLGLAFHSLGDYRRAMDTLRRNVDRLRGELASERFGLPYVASVFSGSVLTWCLTEVGEFGDGAAQGRETLNVAEGGGRPYDVLTAYRGLGLLHLRQGSYDDALSVLERGLALSEEVGFRVLVPWFAAAVGFARASTGRAQEGLALLDGAVARAAAMKLVFGTSLILAWLGEAHLVAGRIGDASAAARRSLDLARERHERGQEAWALRLLGEIAAREDPPDRQTAETHYRDALRLGHELGMRPLIAHCHFGVGTLRLGGAAPAREHLETAAAMYRGMGMRFWLGNEPTSR